MPQPTPSDSPLADADGIGDNDGAADVDDAAVVVQEQWKPFGAAAEIAASIMENVFDELDAPVARVSGEDVPMPYARNLELLATPHEEHVEKAIRSVLYR